MHIAVAGGTIAGDLHRTAAGSVRSTTGVQQVTWSFGVIFVIQVLELDLYICTWKTYVANSGQQIRLGTFPVENVINEDSIFTQAGQIELAVGVIVVQQ